MDEDKVKSYIFKTKEGYLLVVQGASPDGAIETKITKAAHVAAIKELLEIRKQAGIDISKLLKDKGIVICGISHATIALDEGD